MFFSIFTCFYLLLLTQVDSQDVRVDAKAGIFVGIKRNVTVGETTYTVTKFLGIPYAEPPVGKLRFQVPVPKMKHTGSMIVQQFRLRCLEMLPFFQRPQSEDCLYLNVVVPEKFEFEKLAVMVWIHGGGFARDSANDYNVDGFVGHGKVIVVSMNYRLNVWGFLSTEDSNAPGNYGLWDQRLAIKWVKDNIEAFGGDTSRITIFGESAGALGVIYQGLYPDNKEMFQRLIVQSAPAASARASIISPKNNTDALAKHVGCYNENVATMVNCLRNLNVSALNGAMNDANNAPILSFLPSIDNIFVSCNPEDLLNVDKTSDKYKPARETFALFDLLSGINSGEGAMAYNPANGYLNPETFLPNVSYFRSVLVKNLVSALFRGRANTTAIDSAAYAIFDYYTDGQTIDDPYVIRLKALDMYGDAYFFAPTKAIVQAHSKLSATSTFMYYLSVNPSNHYLPTPSWFNRANHADDLLYLFPTQSSKYDEQEFLLAELMITSWTNFAKTGNPNSPSDRAMAWRQYSESNPRYIDLKRGTTSADVKEGLFEDRARFWLNEIPRIIGYESEPCEYILDTSGTDFSMNISYALLAFVLLLCTQLF